jgi:3-oxoacyl-[acyl-carrier-protein] synthase-3
MNKSESDWKIMGMQIVSSAISVPQRVQTAEELAPLIAKTPEWIIQRTGVRNRRVGDSTLDSPTLAAQAARIAIGNHAKPDLVIYAGGVQRQAIPDTSVFLSQELGYEGVPSFSISASCLSFLVGLKMADSLLADRTYSRILLCSADIATHARDLNDAESAALLGDGAAAVLLERRDGPFGVLYYSMRTWPSGAELAELRGGGTRTKLDGTSNLPESNLFQMNGLGLIKFFIPLLRPMLDECLSQCGITIDEIDLVVPHQTSISGFQILSRFGLPPEKTINILADYGNCVSASIPMALAIAMSEGRLRPGSLVLFIGTAAGASAAVMLMRW